MGSSGGLWGVRKPFKACTGRRARCSNSCLQPRVGLGVAVPGSEQVGQELGAGLQISLVPVVVVDVHYPEAVCVPVLPLQARCV